VNGDRFADDQAILNQLPDLRSLTRVSVGDLIGFVGIQPDLLFAAAAPSPPLTPRAPLSAGPGRHFAPSPAPGPTAIFPRGLRRPQPPHRGRSPSRSAIRKPPLSRPSPRSSRY
uniref:Uncharacterized protein n=1 Tax=Falco tinnunculus TaxID=100819 RepID=A0A8C4TX01_FALTI